MRNVRNGYTRFNKTLTTFHSEEFKSQFVLNATVEWQEKNRAPKRAWNTLPRLGFLIGGN